MEKVTLHDWRQVEARWVSPKGETRDGRLVDVLSIAEGEYRAEGVNPYEQPLAEYGVWFINGRRVEETMAFGLQNRGEHNEYLGWGWLPGLWSDSNTGLFVRLADEN